MPPTNVFATQRGSVNSAKLDVALKEAADGLAYYPLVLTTKTATPYVLVMADALCNALLRMNLAGANQVTVPTYAAVPFLPGMRVPIVQWGAGQVSVVGDTGVTVRCGQTAKTSHQYSRVWLENLGTNEWLLAGDLEPA